MNDKAVVRARCGATGRDIGNGMVLYVSAQDNDLAVDDINLDRKPQLGLPLPTDDEVVAARRVVTYMSGRDI